MASSTPAVPEFTRNTEVMRDIRSFDDALALLKDAGVGLVDSKEFGDGFEICKDKAELVGVKFLILGIRFGDSTYADNEKFAVLHVVTVDGRKRILIDGGSGIAAQAQDIYKSHNAAGAGVVCEKGLTRSDYVVITPDPKTGEEVRTPATTFYLS